jgi:hypothetical protein
MHSDWRLFHYKTGRVSFDSIAFHLGPIGQIPLRVVETKQINMYKCLILVAFQTTAKGTHIRFPFLYFLTGSNVGLGVRSS